MCIRDRLDPAGIRFAASLVLLGYILFDREYDKNFLRDTIIYLSAFILITVVGLSLIHI